MAGARDDYWDKLQDFDTHRLIEAVDEVDALRGMLADDGTRPPEIRDRLLKLHRLAMAVINEDAQEDAGELFELAQELGDEVFDMLEGLEPTLLSRATISSGEIGVEGSARRDLG